MACPLFFVSSWSSTGWHKFKTQQTPVRRTERVKTQPLVSGFMGQAQRQLLGLTVSIWNHTATNQAALISYGHFFPLRKTNGNNQKYIEKEKAFINSASSRQRVKLKRTYTQYTFTKSFTGGYGDSVVLRGYSWFCTQELLLADLEDHTGYWG